MYVCMYVCVCVFVINNKPFPFLFVKYLICFIRIWIKLRKQRLPNKIISLKASLHLDLVIKTKKDSLYSINL